MNDRIKELAIDAGIGFTLWDDSGREMIDNYTPEEQLEKFAELLEKEFEAKHFSAGYIAGRSDGTIETVRECIEYLRNCGDTSRVIDLKEHFGVKE